MRTRIDRQGIGRLLTEPQLAAIVEQESNGIAGRARGIAPRDSGEYAASIHVTMDQRGGARRDRPVGHVVASAPHSAAVEWGNSRARAQHPLLHAVQASSS